MSWRQPIEVDAWMLGGAVLPAAGVWLCHAYVSNGELTVGSLAALTVLGFERARGSA